MKKYTKIVPTGKHTFYAMSRYASGDSQLGAIDDTIQYKSLLAGVALQAIKDLDEPKHRDDVHEWITAQGETFQLVNKAFDLTPESWYKIRDMEYSERKKLLTKAKTWLYNSNGAANTKINAMPNEKERKIMTKNFEVNIPGRHGAVYGVGTAHYDNVTGEFGMELKDVYYASNCDSKYPGYRRAMPFGRFDKVLYNMLESEMLNASSKGGFGAAA